MKRPFAYIGFSMAFALAVISLIGTNLIIAIITGLAVMFIASLCLRPLRKDIVIPLCFGSMLAAALLFGAYYSLVALPQIALEGTEIGDFSFYIIDFGERNARGLYTYTAMGLVDDEWIKLKINSASPIICDYYTVVKSKATLYSISSNLHNSYGYWSNGIFLTANVSSVLYTDYHIDSFMYHFLHIRQYVVDTLDYAVGGDAATVASALITGYRGALSDSLRSYFTLSGASHIMAVSGLHLAVVAGSVYGLLRFCRVSDKVSVPITIVLIISYMLLAGMSRSVVRASIMMIVVLSAKLFSTRGDLLNALGVAVFIMCLNPFVIGDIGAVLSVLAVLALIFASARTVSINISPMLEPSPSDIGRARALNYANKVFTTGYVLLFTMPVMYLFFGYFSLMAFVSNIVVVPFGSIDLIVGLLMILCRGIGLNYLASVLARLVQIISNIIISLVHYLSSFDNSIVHLDNYAGLIIAGVLIIFGVCFILDNSVLLRIGFALSTVVVAVSVVFISAFNADAAKVYVTPDNAVVISYKDAVVVSGVSSVSDLCEVGSYLSTGDGYINLLIFDSDKDSYNTKLTQRVPVDIVLTNELTDDILNNGCYNDIELKDNCEFEFYKDFRLSYYNGDFVADVKDVTISSDFLSDSDIECYNGLVEDTAGVVDMTDGGVVYTIYNDKSFSVRRISVWQE